ncbi:MAG: hypothetical protein IBV52_04615 [Candidatus Bathyarchaeota archaeon]
MIRKVSILLVVSLFAMAAAINPVIAPYTSGGQGFPLATPISIASPSNITYSNNELTLIVTFKFLLGPKYSSLSYSLDGKDNVTVPLTGTQEPREVTRTYANGTSVIVNSTLMGPFTITGEVALPELSEGQHKITVYAKYIANQVVALDESTVHFTISNNSEHNISTNLEQKIPEFPSWTILPLTMMATLIGVVVKRRRL